MTNPIHRYGPWALVTGASQGIGEGFARELARRGYHLVLVSRRAKKLAALALELEREHGIQTHILGADLSVPNAGREVVAALGGRDVGLLISNAGAAHMGGFLQNRAEHMASDLMLNALSHMELAHAFGSRLRSTSRTGGILFVSSTAGLQPMAMGANYAAAKAYVNQLGESLHRELHSIGIDVTVLLPGPTNTPGLNHREDIQMANLPMTAMSVDALVAEGLTALRRRRARHIAGRMNRWAARLMPRSVASWLLSTTMQKNAASHLLPSSRTAAASDAARLGEAA